MPRTVILVDDSAALRSEAKAILTEAGFEVVEAEDGLDGLSKVDATSEIALVVCDVNMPRMNGIEMIETLAKREAPMPPVLMLTTEGHPEKIRRAKACGARGWMIKPFKPEMLVAAVKKITAA